LQKERGKEESEKQEGLEQSRIFHKTSLEVRQTQRKKQFARR